VKHLDVVRMTRTGRAGPWRAALGILLLVVATQCCSWPALAKAGHRASSGCMGGTAGGCGHPSPSDPRDAGAPCHRGCACAGAIEVAPVQSLEPPDRMGAGSLPAVLLAATAPARTSARGLERNPLRTGFPPWREPHGVRAARAPPLA